MTNVSFNETVLKQQEELVRYGHWHCCFNCCHGDQKTEPWCSLYKATPPFKTVVVGCQSWQDHDIPF